MYANYLWESNLFLGKNTDAQAKEHEESINFVSHLKDACYIALTHYAELKAKRAPAEVKPVATRLVTSVKKVEPEKDKEVGKF
jgi:hypothetical protein